LFEKARLKTPMFIFLDAVVNVVIVHYENISPVLLVG
jgi:hypothetical protein